MPRPCAVEVHAHSYKKSRNTLEDASPLRRGDSMLLVNLRLSFSSKREPPRHKAVASAKTLLTRIS